MTDTKQVIWEFLTDGVTALTLLVDDRVWSPSAPPEWLNTEAAVIYDVMESAHASGAIQEAVITVNCYGGTTRHSDADEVYRALYDRLHGAHCAECDSGVLHAAFMETGSVGEKEIETGWPFAAATYRVLVK